MKKLSVIRNDTRNTVSLFPKILFVVFIIEALLKKTYLLGFQPDPTQNLCITIEDG